MKEVILITGANGCIAKRLSTILSDNYSIRFLTRKKKNANEYEWNIEKKYIDKKAFENINHIIHLAGTNIAKKRWNSTRKKDIYSSRIDSAKLILDNLKKEKKKIDSFISASAIGYYGTESSRNIFTEKNKKGNDFLSDVCYQWEKIADKFTTNLIANRSVKLRFGVVLSKNSGIIKKIVLPIKLYMGANLGDGKQYIPWIHIDDICGIIKHVIKNKKIKGTYNTVAPEHITNQKFTSVISHIINKPILIPNIPEIIIKLIFGERANILLKGSRVSSRKIEESGYQFKFYKLENALRELLT